MTTELPAPMRETINLLSSSPPPQNSPAPTATTKSDGTSLISSPMLPSPSAMLSIFTERAVAVAKVKEAQGPLEKTSIWDISDDAGEVELPPPVAKRRTAKTTADTGVKKPRAQKTIEKSKVEKKAPPKDRKIKARVVKSSVIQTGTKSKYFPEAQQQTWPEAMVGNQETLSGISVTQDTASKKTALIPKSPNQLPPHLEPPLHVIRRQWTPVKNTVLTLDSSSPLVNGEPKMTKKDIFGSMVDVMRYSTESCQNSREASVSMEDRIGNGLTKKRAIEMIGLPNSAATASKDKLPKPVKPKVAKKKPKTITDQATASYRSATNSTASPILQYFSPQRDNPPNIEDTATQPPSFRKPGSPAKKKRKSDPEIAILLSPTGARKRFDDQDFVFGTCSQLEKADEDEATITYDIQPQTELDKQSDGYDELLPASTSVVRSNFLKTLAKDRKGDSLLRGGCGERERDNVSAGHNDDVYISAVGVREQPVKGRESRLGKFRRTGSGLWNAAARDLEGGLLDVEVLDMTGSDNGDSGCLEFGLSCHKEDDELLGNRAIATGKQVIGRPVTRNDVGGSCQSIRRPQVIDSTADACETNPVQTIGDLKDNTRITGLRPIDIHATSATAFRKSANLAICKINLPTPTSTLGVSSRSISSRAAGVAVPSVSPIERPANPPDSPIASKAKKSKQPKPTPVMPDFRSYLTTTLKAEVAKFGFKNKRTRDKMISCLEECWEAQNRAACDSGPVGNPAGPAQRDTVEEETATALHLHDDTAAASQKPKASATRKKAVEKVIPKSPRRKAKPKSKSLSSKVAPLSDSGDGAPEAVDLSAQPRSPKKKSAPALKPRTRKPSVPSPSPGYAVLKGTQLHRRISEVVCKSGRTKSESSPYHAILMYDPIVLEDMTLWLNTHMKEEVSVEDVKTWCEANGVCCVWSESLRGKQRKRF